MKNKGNNGYEYDYKYKCLYEVNNSQKSCKKEERKCEDYNFFLSNGNNLSPSICAQLKTTDSDKRCVYDSSRSRCKEEYSTCELYNEKEIKKNRHTCEDFIMLVLCIINKFMQVFFLA